MTHHQLFSHKDSEANMVNYKSPGKEQLGSPATKLEDHFNLGQKEHVVSNSADPRHAKLINSIINPDNPFAKMTEKDMLIFNPNYHAYLAKMKSNVSKKSELTNIMNKPLTKNQRKKKEELVLYAYFRE